MIVAVKAGARGLGMEVAGALRDGDAERLYITYERNGAGRATEIAGAVLEQFIVLKSILSGLYQIVTLVTHVADAPVHFEPLESLGRFALERYHLFGALLWGGRI